MSHWFGPKKVLLDINLEISRGEIVALVGPSLNTVIGIVIIASIPVYARVVRTQTLALRERDFIVAERAMGASSARILFRHLLPNVVGPLVILLSMDVPIVIMLEAGLSYLNLGVRPPTPSTSPMPSRVCGSWRRRAARSSPRRW